MLNALIAWSLRHRPLVLGGAALLVAVGTWTAIRMPVDVLPDLTAPTVTVLTEAQGMAPEEVEALVTFPLEAALNGATGVRRVRSSTARGISVVWVEFDWNMEIFRARQIVTEKLQAAANALPAGAGVPVLAPVSSVMGEIMMIGLTGGESPMALRTFADWTVRRRLLAVPGVAQVIPIGGEVRQYQVLPDPARMQAVGVTLDHVMRAAGNANANAAGGIVAEAGQEYVIRGVGRVRSAAEIGQSVVAVRAGVPILLREVADVAVGGAPKTGDGSVNASPGVVLAVQKQPQANTLEVTRRIEAELDRLRATLPPGVAIHAELFRQADFIQVAVGNVLKALRDGALLVVVILLLFLANVRATAISVLAIPLSLLVAILAMQALGLTINTMSLGGMAIAIGALVDDAIIDVENVFRRLRENHQRPAPERHPVMVVVYEASREIRASIVNATAVIIIVLLPLFFLTSVEGRLLQPLGFAYVVAILASLVVAVTVTPALCLAWLPSSRGVRAQEESRLVTRLKRWYARALEAVLARPRRVVVSAAAALAAALASTPLLGTSFLPAFNEGALTVSVVTLPGTALDQANALGRRVEQILLDHPAVASTDRRQGRAELDEHAQGVNAGEIDVTLRPGSDREELLATLRDAFTAIPGTVISIGQPIGHRIDHLLSGTRASIAVKIFGPDLTQLRHLGAAVERAMQGVRGVADLQREQVADVPQLRIEADRPALAGHGLTVGDLATFVDVALNGAVASQVYEESRVHDLVVRLTPGARHDLDAISRLRLPLPDGATVPLPDVARVRRDLGPNSISRENVQRKLVVQANVAERDLGGTVADVRRAVEQVPLPEGYHVEFGGQFESQASATRTLAFLSAVSLVGIVLILLAEFRSLPLATLVLVNLPLALVGGVAAVWLTGGVVSVASLVGFVTLFGIATRNGILLVAHYQHLAAEGIAFEEVLRRGALERLAPILMTALTAGLALLPLALGGGEPGNELQTPMAIVILGGLLSATALNMLVLPALYALYGRARAGRDGFAAPAGTSIAAPG